MMEGYKDSAIGMIPNDWDVISLGELRNKSDRYSFTGGPFGSNLKAEHYTKDGVRIIQLQNIGEGKFINDSKIFTSTEKADELFSCNIFHNEIILAKMAPVARSCKIPNFNERYVMCSDGIRLSVDKNRFDNEFVFQALNTNYFLNAAESKSTGTTRSRIGLNDLRELPIAIPRNKREQTKIASILSVVDDKIDAINDRITQTQQFKNGLMQRLLTKGIGHTKFKDSPLGEIPESWMVKQLTEICEKISVGFVGTCEKYYTNSVDGILMLRTGNLSDGEVILKNIKYVTKEFHSKNRKSQIFQDDILIARHGNSGQAVIVPKDFPISNCLNIVIVRIKKETIDAQFIKYQFNSSIISTQIRKKTAGSTQGVVNTGEIATTFFLIPPLHEQKQIADIFIMVDEKLNILKEKKFQFDKIKNGLMQQLLTGKIRVNLNQ